MKKLKVLFCSPPYHPNNLADHKIYVTEPLQYEVLASLLDSERFDVRVLDLRLDRRKGALLQTLKSYRPDVLGMTSWTMHVASVKKIFRAAKAFDDSIITIVGGEHTRIAPEEFAIREVDFVVNGEGYPSFTTLMDRIYHQEEDFSHIEGIAYQAGGEFFSNGEGIVTRDFDLDALPFPDRSITDRYRKHYYHLWWKPLASVRTAMGCPWRCSFCNLWKVNRGKYLQWSPEYVADYLESLDEPYVLFVDDHFFGDVRRAYKIAEIIQKRGIRKQYCLYSRSDAVAHNPELVKLWASIGLKRVRMGLESYSDVTLEGLDKCNSVEHNDLAISNLKKHGVLTEGLFIIGLDYTANEFTALADYITSRKIEVPNITVHTPMPGTPEFQETRDRMAYRGSEFFDFQHATLETSLPMKEFCHRYGKLMLKAQRPPAEQIGIVGLKMFAKRMPFFWAYFWSLWNSHKHYTDEKRIEPGTPWESLDNALLKWNEEDLKPAEVQLALSA